MGQDLPFTGNPIIDPMTKVSCSASRLVVNVGLRHPIDEVGANLQNRPGH